MAVRIHLTGRMASGKTVIARLIEKTLLDHGFTNVKVDRSVGPGLKNPSGLPTEIVISENNL